ncbi:MAG: hypothetical protein LBF91_03185 [Azoarcus sp.]|jgi:hypothetical protein|nr:hypothetical protein [Azoarcus sp.]
MTASNTSEAPSPSGWFCFFGLLFYFLAGFIVALPLRVTLVWFLTGFVAGAPLEAAGLFWEFLFLEKILPFTLTFCLLVAGLCYGGRHFNRKYRPSGGTGISSFFTFIFGLGSFYAMTRLDLF